VYTLGRSMRGPLNCPLEALSNLNTILRPATLVGDYLPIVDYEVQSDWIRVKREEMI
jgi:hypothetical protein